ncbi:MAG: MFS transporter [Actinocatenispora sp.]
MSAVVTAARTSRVSSTATLLAVLLGVLVVAMSIAGTAVAVPRIGSDLGASGARLQWVVAGYNLTFAAFTLVCGSLADLFGRRRTFLLGAVIFTVGALASGVAGSIWLLDVARLLSGVGGAAIMASGGALVASAFDGPARTRAFAALGTMAGTGVAIGPTLSGWVVGWFGWRTTFLGYVAVGALITVATVLMAESRADTRPRIDRTGVIMFIAALALIMFAVMRGPEYGWTNPTVLAPLGVGAVLLVAFGAVERRRTTPVLDLDLLRDRRFLGWSLGTLVTSVGFLGVLVFLPTYLQGVSHAPVSTAGALMLMLTAPILLLPPLAGALINRGVPARLLMTVSLMLIAAGNAALAVLLRPGVGAGGLLVPLLAVGAGTGISFGITDGQAMSVVNAERVGMAAGFLNTIRGSAEALVIAGVSAALLTLVGSGVGPAVAARVTAGDLTGTHGMSAAQLADRFTNAWHVLSWTVAGVCAVSVVLVSVLLGRRRA